MIIDPDMPDHWKTRMLVDLLGGDELAPIYLIRLWGHCQNRKKCEFDSLPPAAVKAICRFPGAPEALNDALIECGFIERDNKQLIVCGWAEHNAALVKNWENGKRGGRPPKSGQDETEREPNGNPKETQEKPTDNPGGTGSKFGQTDREDREDREEKSPPKSPKGDRRSKLNVTVDHMLLTCSGLSEQLAGEYLAFRKSLKAPLTESAWKNIAAEIAKSNASPDDALSEAMAAGWRSFKAQWLENRNAGGRPQQGQAPGPRKELRLD